MKQLSTVLNNISFTANKTDIAPVERKYSLTSGDLKTITAKTEQFKADLPQIQAKKALVLLKLLGNLSQKPAFKTNTIYTEYGPDFIPVDIVCETLNAKQKAIAQGITQSICQPISSEEFAMLYSKLRLLCTRKEPVKDEKAVMYAYYEELQKYPASIVREAMKRAYKWFPSYYELDDICKTESRYIELMKKKFLKE